MLASIHVQVWYLSEPASGAINEMPWRWSEWTALLPVDQWYPQMTHRLTDNDGRREEKTKTKEGERRNSLALTCLVHRIIAWTRTCSCRSTWSLTLFASSVHLGWKTMISTIDSVGNIRWSFSVFPFWSSAHRNSSVIQSIVTRRMSTEVTSAMSIGSVGSVRRTTCRSINLCRHVTSKRRKRCQWIRWTCPSCLSLRCFF